MPMAHSHSTGCGFSNLCPEQGCSLVPCKVLEHGTSPAVPFPASSRTLRGGCLGMDDSPARVPCATWSCPSRNKAPYLFTRGPGSVATAASSFPSSPGMGTSPHASPRLSSCPASGFLALLWHTRASRCSLPKEDGWCWDTARSWMTPSKAASAASSPHQGFTSSEDCVPRWFQRLSPGGIGSLGCWMDVAASPGLFAGAEARLSSSVMGGHPKHTFGLWDPWEL